MPINSSIIIKLAQKLNEPVYFNYNTISKEDFDKLHQSSPVNTSLFSTKDANGVVTYHKVNSNQNWIKGAWPAENAGQTHKKVDFNTMNSDSGFDENLDKQFPNKYKDALRNWNISHIQNAAEGKANEIKFNSNKNKFYRPVTKENSNKQFFSKPN